MFFMTDTASPIAWHPRYSHDLGGFREWLGQREVLSDNEGRPIWWRLMIQGGWECLEELLACDPNEHDLLLDWKDGNGRGWVWTALSFQTPTDLMLRGVERLGPGWDEKDTLGHDPLMLAREVQSIQAMARRLWRDTPLTYRTRLAPLAQKAWTPAARRAWHFWQQGVNSPHDPDTP